MQYKYFALLLLIPSLCHYQNVSGSIAFKEKAVTMSGFPEIDEQVWWIERATEFQNLESAVTLTEEDQMFCSPQTFFGNCGPIRVKWDIVNGRTTIKTWAFNERKDEIYYFESHVKKNDDAKAIFRKDVDRTGKVAGSNNKPSSIEITDTAEMLQEQEYAILYGDPTDDFQILADDRNVWIQVRDYVVKQNKVRELFINKINLALKDLDLSVPEERFVDLDEKFDFKVDYFQFEGLNCKVQAISLPSLPHVKSIAWWTDRVTSFEPSLAVPKAAITDRDAQFCSTMAFFDKCGPLRTSWETKNGNLFRYTWAYLDENNGNGKVYYSKSEIEKVHDSLAIFRAKINPQVKVIAKDKNLESIFISEQALELQEEPYAQVYCGPNEDFKIFADCDGKSSWVLVKETLTGDEDMAKLVPLIKNQLQALGFENKFGSRFQDIKEKFPFEIDFNQF